MNQPPPDPERRAFIAKSCACGVLLLAGTNRSAADTADPKPTTNAPINPINPAQVMSVLYDIDHTGDGSLIDAVFTRWGNQCLQTRTGLKAFAERQRADFQGYIAFVNQGRAHNWEKIEYDQAGGVLKVTGRKSGKCVCPYAQCPQPAKALCTHCCKAFQTELFKTMTGREVTVRIDETILLGGERCRTTIRLLGKAQPEGANPS
jgi:hypothetical protein